MRTEVIAIFFIFVAFNYQPASGGNWGYSGKKGPANWEAICATGQSQSPVNLENQVFDKNLVLDPFVFSNYQTNLVGAKLNNNGHTVQLDSPNDFIAQISGGGLNGTYQFAQLHFHWGDTQHQGSEHTLNGQAYPLEVHLVHFNTKYGSLGQAAAKPDGLAVLGIFYSIQRGDNIQWTELTAKLAEVKKPKGNAATISSLSLENFLPSGTSPADFYRYSGSLTTPGCFESVTWTVFREPLKISEGQMSFFRSLSFNDGKPMVNNFRPVQPHNSRKISASFMNSVGPEWGYSGKKGAEYWGGLCATGKSQSPVDLKKQVFDKNSVTDPFVFVNYQTKIKGANLKNNGHSVKLNPPNNFTAQISGGGLGGTYQFAQMHFHWGDKNQLGSEHTLDGQAFPLEVHLVHFNTKYGTLAKAANKPDGLAVLGIFFVIQQGDNNQWSDLTDKMAKVKDPSQQSSATISTLGLENFLPSGPASQHYYRYAGSLTTPPCFESVTWTVFHEPLTISEGQMSFFRSLSFKDGNPMVNNFRPVQPLYGRKISASYSEEDSYSWGYSGKKGPNHWDNICEKGKSQSPVDLEKQVFDQGSVSDPFNFTNYESILKGAKLKNNGHTVQLDCPSDFTAQISGGGLGGMYQFAQLHFHWGDKNTQGSEHTMNGDAFPLEVHLVHFNTKYGSLAKAASKPDGLAVLGIFYEIQQGDNNQWSDLTAKLAQVKEPKGDPVIISSLSLKNFLPSGAATQHFYRYAGSLTTPPCFESVTWTVFHEPLTISEAQMSFFRSLLFGGGKPMVNNFRPVQPLNGRSVSASYTAGPRSLPTTYENNSNKYFHKKWKDQNNDSDKKPKEVDHFFLLIMSIIIFFMQCGFAFMEAGAVRSKNTVNILIKNWLDMCIGALVYWAVGFALTFGQTCGHFMGSDYFFFNGLPGYKLSKWFFQFVFAATAATLVSGSLAERCNFVAYLVYSVMITGFIYPIIAHWAWHPEGWLYIQGFHDFAGSGVVHLTGAVCALVGCILMGPRIGRFDKNGNPCDMPGHSVPLSALGGLILIFGFFACNGTKQGSISNPGDGIAVATAIVNTALGTSAAGVCTLLFNKIGIIPGTGGNYSFLITMNGSLTGTVALCAGCNVYPAWAAVIVGAICGPLFLCCNWLLIHCKIDDPLDAIPVHGAGGIWGTLAVHLFKWDGVLMSGSSEAASGLGWNIVGLIAIISWTGTLSFIMFYSLKKVQMLRVEAAHEFKGMDMLKHGESAYPADAWVEQQYMKEDALSGGDELTPDGGTGNGSSTSGAGGKGGGKSKDGLPPNMRFSRAASYNNPHEMFPSASKLFAGMNAAAGGVTKSSGKTSRASSMSVVNEAEDGTPEEKEKLNVIQELTAAGDLANIAIAMVTATSADTENSKKDENTLI